MNMKLSLGSKPGGGGLQENKNRPSASSTRNAFGSSAGSTASTKGKTKKISAFGDDDGDEDEVDANKEDGMPGPSRSSTSSTSKQSTKKPPHIPISTATSNNSRILAKLHSEAQSIDPTIFSYDEVYDSMKSAQQAAIEARKAAKEAEGDAPKYVSGLLKAAEVRKKDRIRAEDKLIEREREKEGDEFGDKDAFVTAAYKEQQEELRRLEEEEQLKEEQAAKRPGGMSEYYKRELAQSEAIHEAAMKAASATTTSGTQASTSAAAAGGGNSSTSTSSSLAKEAAELAAHGPKSEAAIAEEASKLLGRNVTVNEEGQIVDKRELLTGGLNVKPRKAVQGPASAKNGKSGGGIFSMSISERKSQQDEIKKREEERRKREDEASIGMTGLSMAERQKISRERQSKELERQMLLANEKKRKIELEKELELEKKVKVRKNDESKIEEMKRKALERRMAAKQKQEQEPQNLQATQ